ncbi:acyl-CoA N-acyltransferase [Rhizoctonia solani]|nr:acyl-CoA N-acyltransferase [Rhizoctonia solani]
MSRLPDQLFFDLVRPEEIDAAYELEAAGYPADEAASLDALRYRQSVAPDYFLGAYISTPRSLIGFITHEPEPKPSSVCIHSVCVSSAYRGRGVALKLLQEYLERLEKMPDVARVLLICKTHLKPLYARAGFGEVGPSAVVHGQDPWFEMSKDFNRDQPSQAAVLAALQAQSTRPKAAQQAYTSFEHPSTDLTYGDNPLILSRGVATWTPAEHATTHPEIFMSSQSEFPVSLPDGPTGWWLVKPSPMQFENIGFSRAVGGDGGIKYLSCAECDLGPLGWCVERGPTEFWVNAGRVGYRTT